MGCDIKNYKVLKIQHTLNDVTLYEIIVLSTDEIYLHCIQYDEENKDRDFLAEGQLIIIYFKNILS